MRLGPLVVGLGLGLSTGCLSAHTGLEAGLPSSGRPVHAVATVNAGGSYEAWGWNYDMRLRTGLGGTEVSAGMNGYITPVPSYRPIDLTARVYALEVGRRQGEGTFGGLSPAVGVRMWIPDADSKPLPAPRSVSGPKTSSTSVNAKVVTLWLGYDLRTNADHRSPYLGLTLGYGRRGVPKSSVPESVRELQRARTPSPGP